MTLQNTTGTSPGTDEVILLVIHDVVQHTADSNDSIGDIILTDLGFYFLGYEEIQDIWSEFGLVGVVGMLLTQKKQLSDSRKNTARIRQDLYGLGLRKRTELKGQHITATYAPTVVPLADVVELRVISESQISLSTQDLKQYQYWIPGNMDLVSQDVVMRWPKSVAYYDRLNDPDGFFAGSTSPRELLMRVANGDSAAAAEIYQLSNKKEYLNVLFANMRVLPGDERRSVLNIFSSAPGEFLHSLLAFVNNMARAFIRRIISNVLLLLLGSLFGLDAIVNRVIETGIPAFLLIILCTWGLLNNSRALKVAKEVQSALK